MEHVVRPAPSNVSWTAGEVYEVTWGIRCESMPPPLGGDPHPALPDIPTTEESM